MNITLETRMGQKTIATLTQQRARSTNVTRWCLSDNLVASRYLRGYGGDKSTVTTEERKAITAALLAA